MTIYLKGKSIIDCVSAKPINGGVIAVHDGKIQAILEKAPDGARVLDCGNATLMPGLIDSHIHVGEDAGRDESVKQQHLQPDPLRAIRGAVTLKNDLMAGVTSARALGDGQGCVDVIIRDAIERGEIIGPRLQVAAHAIRPSHGTAPEIGIAADGEDEIRKAVRKAIFDGADVIKLFVSNVSRGETYLDYLKGDLTQVSAYTKREMEVAVEEASRCGIKVAGHCIGGKVVQCALEAGLASLEHANLIEEEDIPYFLKYGGYISDPNLILFFDPVRGFESPTIKTHKWNELPSWWHEKVWRAREQTVRVMGKALKAGVKFALGTDLNHTQLWLECKYFIEKIGADNMRALAAVTMDSAKLLGVDDQVGSLEAGKLADIIAVDGDPLADISALSRVKLVMKDGEIVKQEI